MKYNVHYSGYYAYNIEVDAENEDEASKKAAEIFDTVPADEFTFESTQEEIWEVKDNISLAREVMFRETMDGPDAP